MERAWARSRGAEPRVLAWRVGTREHGVVSRIVGLGADESFLAAFAALS
ncbi:hypothetical protein [Nocardioides dongkuii]|nr:hypothetical protein [Nocardioides dongkuii]